MSPEVKRTIVIAGVATLTVVGVLAVIRLVSGPRASIPRAGVISVTGRKRPNHGG